METILSTSDLTKHYGPILALNGLNLHVEKGSVYGILGPNGSGKTTTLGIVLGILNRTKGSFSWFSNGEIDTNRKRIGAILEHPIFYPYLSGLQNLKITCKIKDVDESDIDRVLGIVDLMDRKNSPAKTYSLGMKQRLALAAALLGDPEVLVLDEPTNGLDPQGIVEVRDLIHKISAMGKTIIIASHILDEIEKVCTHVSVIKKGNLLAEGSVAEILKGENQLEIAALNQDKLKALLSTYKGIKKIQQEKSLFLVNIEDEVQPAHLNRFLLENNCEVTHLMVRKKRLEEQFLELTAE